MIRIGGVLLNFVDTYSQKYRSNWDVSMLWIYLHKYCRSMIITLKNKIINSKAKKLVNEKKQKEYIINNEYFPIISSPICLLRANASCSHIFGQQYHYGRRTKKKLAYRPTYHIFACAPRANEEIRHGTEKNNTLETFLDRNQHLRSLESQVDNAVKNHKLNIKFVGRVIIENKESMFQEFRRALMRAKNAHSTDINIYLLGHGTADGKFDLFECAVPLDKMLRFFKKAHHRYKANITVIPAMCHGHKYSISKFDDEPGFKVIPLTNVEKPYTKVLHEVTYEVTGGKRKLCVTNSVHKDLNELLFKII